MVQVNKNIRQQVNMWDVNFQNTFGYLTQVIVYPCYHTTNFQKANILGFFKQYCTDFYDSFASDQQ